MADKAPKVVLEVDGRELKIEPPWGSYESPVITFGDYALCVSLDEWPRLVAGVDEAIRAYRAIAAITGAVSTPPDGSAGRSA